MRKSLLVISCSSCWSYTDHICNDSGCCFSDCADKKEEAKIYDARIRYIGLLIIFMIFLLKRAGGIDYPQANDSKHINYNCI